MLMWACAKCGSSRLLCGMSDLLWLFYSITDDLAWGCLAMMDNGCATVMVLMRFRARRAAEEGGVRGRGGNRGLSRSQGSRVPGRG